MSPTAAEIRAGLSHPVIDADGHMVEYFPLLLDLLREDAGQDVADRYAAFLDRVVPVGERRRLGAAQTAFCGYPAANTLDRATVMLPGLLHGRMEELGFDFALLYPSAGLHVCFLPDAELRTALAHACNRYYAEVHEGYRDRLEPVAVIPTGTPEEAVAELEHAVVELGLRSIVMSGVVPRTTDAEGNTVPRWMDTLAHDSLYDYDPLWQRCQELRVVPTFHGAGIGFGTRASTTNYVFNHLGSFAAAQEAICRAIVVGGVAMRFPELRFAFLEGGVTWAAQLYADLLSHHAKRSGEALADLRPDAVDVPMLRELFGRHATGALRDRADRLEENLFAKGLGDRRDGWDPDDFSRSGITAAADLVDLFSRRFSFGCEADDPMNALAFDRRLHPHGIELQPMLSSDIGHWDVTDASEVLPEAWEAVEDGRMSEEQFADFACGNAVRTHSAVNPDFFTGTAVAGAVASALS